jgi:predicted O-methyltransferase YrrM
VNARARAAGLGRKAIAYAAAYARGARLVARGRSVGGEFDPAFAHARRVGITQKPEEIAWLFARVAELRPERVLEIGTDEGGTLFLWTRAAAPDARLVAVDTRPLGPLAARSPFALTLRGFTRARQRIAVVMPADSHDPSTREHVETLLGGQPLDFLFLDGDHGYEGIWQDFRMYAPLVRPGGLVAFHDVSQDPAPSTEGVARFWREFGREHETEELVAAGDAGFGIGLYRVPSA